MAFKSLSLRALLIASTAILAPAFAAAQTETDAETETEATPADADPAAEVTDAGTAAAETAAAAEEDVQVVEVVVLGRYIPEVLRETSEVAAFLSSEDLERQGDSDAASALARVTGLSIAEGKFVYVRGLGERYSSARLNGSPLPSPEPLQRVVPLDLFPTKILENVLVQKTYSAEYPGEFGGGIVDLRTLNIPNEDFFKLSVSGSWNSETTGLDGLTYFGSDSDVIGFDDGTRKIPGPIRQAMATGTRITDVNFPDEIQGLGQSFRNAEIRLLQQNDSIPLNGSYSLSGGKVVDVGDARFGVVGVLGYSNGWETRNGRQEVGEVDDTRFAAETFYDYVQTNQNIGIDALLGLGVDLIDDKIDWTNLYIRKTSKEAFSREGFDGLAAAEVRDDRTAWFDRELYSTQLNGRHFRGPWTFDWRTALSQTRRDSPYESNTRFGFNDVANSYIYGGDASDNNLGFSYLDDKVVSGAFDVEYVQELSSARDVTYSAGFEAYRNTRDAQTRDFGFVFNSSTDNSADFLFLQQRPDFLFSNYNIRPDRLVLREVTGTSGAAAYNAGLEVFGAYAKFDAEIIPLVRLAMGVRYENGAQNVEVESLIADEPISPDDRIPGVKNNYFLPAGTLTWNFAEDQQLRLGASMSIGRPQFRELAPQQYFDSDSGRTFIGNPYLQDTELKNLDARYEWFFDRGQAFTAGVFFKELEKPVEAVVVSQSASVFQTYLNVPKATLFGAEIDFKKVFDSPFSSEFLSNKEFLVQANYTYTKSELNIEPGDEVFPLQAGGQARPATDFANDGDSMQGQSEHIANVQLGWTDEVARSQGTLLATFASERISARAPGRQPDFVQDPGMVLDFVFKKGFDLTGREFNVDFKVNNITGERFYESQKVGGAALSGIVIVNEYDLGTTVSLGLSTEF